MNSHLSYKAQLANAPIYLLHGWGMNQNVWKLVLPELRLRLKNEIRPLDLPGYGDNGYCPYPYDLESLTSWLAMEIKEPAIVLGWSLGGLVAQQLAFQHPEKVLKLGLIGSTPKFVEDNNWAGIKSKVLSSFAQQLQKDHNKTIEKFMAIQALGSPHAKQDIKQIKELVLSADAPNQAALSAGLTMLKQVDLRQQFSKLTVPVVGVFGRLDSLVPAATIEKLEKLNSKFQADVLASASHAPFISHKDQFVSWFGQLVEQAR